MACCGVLFCFFFPRFEKSCNLTTDLCAKVGHYAKTASPQLQLVLLSSIRSRNYTSAPPGITPRESGVPGKKKKVYNTQKRVSFEAAVETSAAWNALSSVTSGCDVNVLEHRGAFGSGIF